MLSRYVFSIPYLLNSMDIYVLFLYILMLDYILLFLNHFLNFLFEWNACYVYYMTFSIFYLLN